MAAAAITSSSSSSISNVTSNAASNAAILALSSTSRTSPSAGSSEAVTSGSLSSPVVVSSSSSRSRRSKISHYYQGSGAGTSNISSTSSFTNSDSKPMHPSSNVSSSSKSTSHASGSSETPSKLKNNQRRWKDDSSCKSKSLKWKTNSDHVANSEEVVERSTSKAARWKTTEKSKLLSANLYKMRGMKWKAFTDHIFENDDELRNISEEDDETVLRLDQSDMGLYGLCPETDPFYAVICDICNAVVKPQGLQKHLVHRHHSSHNSKHSQHSVNHHRNVFASYSTIGSGIHVDRVAADHTTTTPQANTVISSTTLQVSPADRHEKASLLSKSATRDISPGRSHSSHQQGSSKSSGGSGAHSSSSSSTSKSKSKSTSKVKSKSGKSGKSKSGGNSSNHSSTAPSPSSSSCSSYSGATSRNGSSAITTTNTPSNGSTATTSGIHQASASPASGNSTTSTTSSFSSNKSNTTSPTAINQSQTNQKNLRTSGSSIASSLTQANSTHNNAHLSQSSSQNNAVISSKACSSTSSKQNSLTNDSAGTSTHSSNPSSPHDGTASCQNINNTVTSSTNSAANNVSASSVTPRRTYGRCKSSSVERKTVPVKEREYDANKHCGVVSGESCRPCTRSLTCKAHSLSMRRMVSGRSKSFDKLLADHRATKEQPQPTVKSRAMPELESSNSSSSIDLDRRSVSSNSNLSVEVQASSTASSQSSATSAVESVSCNRKQATPPPLANAAVNKSNNSVVPLCTSGGSSSGRETAGLVNNRLAAIPAPSDQSSDPAIVETVETVCVGGNDNTIQININRDGTTQSIPSNRRSNANPSQQQRRGSSEESHRARITTRVIDTNRAEVPPELLDDSKFTTNIFSPESTVLTGPIRLLAEDENGGGSSKRLRVEAEPELDLTNLSDEKRLQLMVQRKVNKKNKVLFRDPNRPSPSAITIPHAAEIVAQAFAEENPSATLTDAQFVMDPETNVVSVSVCGTFNPDNMQLNWAPFNQDFVNNTLSQALSPYGITVPPVAAAQPEQQAYGNRNLMPNPEEEGFQIHHLPPLTEEEYNQMRPEFINGMPKPSMLGCPGIKTEIKQEVDDDTNKASLIRQPLLPMIKQEGLRDGIKVEIKQEPMDEEPSENLGTTMDGLDSSHTPLIPETKSDVSQISTTIESITDTSTVSESAVPDWNARLDSLNSTASSEVLAEKTNQNLELMSLDVEDSSDDSYVDYLQPIATLMSRVPGDAGLAANGKENSNSENDDRATRYQNQGNYSSDEYACRSGSNHDFYYGRLPKPNHVNTFGLVKLRGSTNFKKSILCTRRANSSIHAYQTLFQGGHCTFFRRDNTNTLGSKHCTVDCNGAISLNGSTTFDGGKVQSTNSPGGGPRNNCATAGNSTKTAKQTRRQNSGSSPNSLLLKRQSSNFALTSASTQTPPSSPFYKRHNSVTAGNKVRLQKRSIIMHFRGNGSSQQHLSKTCAILQSQIVHKLAEQLLGFKKNNSRSEQTTPSTSFIKAAVGKQPLQQNHHSSNINCKLPPSSSSVPSLMYQSTSIESGSLQSGITSSLPTLSSALSSPPIQQNSTNPVKIPRTSATVVSCSSINSLAKVAPNAVLSRMSNNSISQRFSAVTPVAIVAPLVAQTAPANPLAQTSSTVGLTACNNGNVHQGRGRSSMYRQNSMLNSSTPGPSTGALNGIGGVKSNAGINGSGVN